MKLVFQGGGVWNGVELTSDRAPQEVHLSGVIVDNSSEEADPEVPTSLRKTALMDDRADDLYELDRFEGPNEDTAVYVFKAK